MANNPQQPLTSETAKKYCQQRRNESMVNILNTKITIADKENNNKKQQDSLGNFFTVGEGKETVNVLENLLNKPLSPPQSEDNEDHDSLTSFGQLLSQQHNTLFKKDEEDQQKLQADNYRELLKGNMNTYGKVVNTLNDNQEKALKTLNNQYAELKASLDNIITTVNNCDDTAIEKQLGLTSEQINAFREKWQEATQQDSEQAQSPLIQSVEKIKQHLDETCKKEQHEIKRLYQQRRNNLKKAMNKTDAMIAFKDQQAHIAKMDRQTLQTDETDADIDRRCALDFNLSDEFQYRAMIAQLQQEKAQGQGQLTLPGVGTSGLLSQQSFINIDWQYNKNNNSYTFSCNLSRLKTQADKEAAVKHLVDSAAIRGSWIDISGIGDREFFASATAGTFADTQGGIKGWFSNSGAKRKMALMAVAVEQAAFRGFDAENIRGVIIGPENPKLAAAYQKGLKRRMKLQRKNGSFSKEADRATAVQLKQYPETQGPFLETACNNGFEGSKDTKQHVIKVVEKNPQLQNNAYHEKLQMIAQQDENFDKQLQQELDDFVTNYKATENHPTSREDFLKSRQDSFVEWANADAKQDQQGINAQQRYQQWQNHQKESRKTIDQHIEPVAARLEEKEKKKGKKEAPPSSVNLNKPNNDSNKSESGEEVKQEKRLDNKL
ncbi:MAG: hypothetical protein ACX932_01500 [Gammaproteobacteria bacterium]